MLIVRLNLEKLVWIKMSMEQVVEDREEPLGTEKTKMNKTIKEEDQTIEEAKEMKTW